MHYQDNILTFESIAELRDFASRPAPANIDMHAWLNSNALAEEKGDAWFGVGTYKEVQQIFHAGWKEGVELMVEAMSEIATPIASTVIRRRKSRGDHGDEYDWQAGKQGMSDIAWTRTAPRKVAAPRTITLCCAISDDSSHLTHHSAFFWRGAAALFLADRLSAAGYNVQIIASTRHTLLSQGNPIQQFNVVVKRPDMPVDLNALAASLCFAAFFRTLILSAICAFEKNSLQAGISRALPAVAAPGEYRIWADSKDSATAAILKTLAAIENGVAA